MKRIHEARLSGRSDALSKREQSTSSFMRDEQRQENAEQLEYGVEAWLRSS